MSCKFLRIKELPADCYEVWFLVNGKKQNIFTQGIESLMMAVLNEDNYDGPSEWDRWCEDGTLPEIYGHISNEWGEGDIEFAEHYFKENEESFELCFPELAA